MKSRKIIMLCLITVPLITGAVIYYLLAPGVYFVRLADRITHLNIHIYPRGSLLIFIRSYVPDIMWSFSLTCVIYVIMGRVSHTFIVAAGAVILMEMMQIGGAFGTFDLMDMVVQMIGVVVALYTTNIIMRRKEK
ncbi:MAG: hypothetical protein IJ807_06090 [Eubacterium sp.]|nr:hypothetical protein [Eubacterium sp.]